MFTTSWVFIMVEIFGKVGENQFAYKKVEYSNAGWYYVFDFLGNMSFGF